MKLRMNDAVMGVELSGIREFAALVQSTPGACALTIGEPDMNTPEHIKDAAKAALDANETHYPPGNGYPYLLEEIAAFEAANHGLHYRPEEIIVTMGGTEALYISLATVLNPGDEVIIPTPAFGLYEDIVRLCRGVPVLLPTEHNGFQLDAAELQAAITPATKAVILNSPNNPTGCIYTKETLSGIHEVLKDKPIFVLCDDVYRTLVYTGEYHSFAEFTDMRDRVIVIQSFSKPYAMTGWRLGYCLADAPVRDRMQMFHQYSVVGAPSFVQRACVAALRGSTEEVKEIFAKRRAYVCGRLREMGLSFREPEGAFYVFVCVENYGMDSLTFCKDLLAKGKVGLTPGLYFGTDGYVRLSYCYSDEELKTALDRMEAYFQSR